jgi:hypothetical protein
MRLTRCPECRSIITDGRCSRCQPDKPKEPAKVIDIAPYLKARAKP